MRVGRGDHKQDINIGKSFEALGDAKSQALVRIHPSQAATKLENLIIKNSRAGTHLLHVLKRLSMLLCYLGILLSIQWKNVLMA